MVAVSLVAVSMVAVSLAAVSLAVIIILVIVLEAVAQIVLVIRKGAPLMTLHKVALCNGKLALVAA